MENKQCNKCKEEKPLNNFSKRQSKCKRCFSDYQKEWRENNQQSILEYRENNKENRKEIDKIYKNKFKEKHRIYDKIYKESKKEEIKIYNINYKNRKNQLHNEKYKNDPLYRLNKLIRRNIYHSLKSKNSKKHCKTIDILGCSFEEFKLYLENKFESWMTWNNHGLYNGELNYGWDIDHIIPISSATNEEEIIKLNHYTN